MIEWEGDLEDDCKCRHGKLSAHAERLDEDLWYCGVYAEGRVCVFHSITNGIRPTSGVSARALSELVMLAHEKGVDVAGLFREVDG